MGSTIQRRRALSETGAAITEYCLIIALLLPLGFASLNKIAIKSRSAICKAEVMLDQGGGSATTEDLPEAHGPNGCQIWVNE